jgi:hypothetical protein
VNFVAGTVATFSFISPAKMIEALRGTLSDADVKKGTERKLNDILDNATKDLDRGKTPLACRELDDFVNELNHGGKKIGSADLATILAKVNEIQIALGC